MEGLSPLPGHLGHYRIARLLGRGGMGVVFEAEDTRLQRRVALKTIEGDLTDAPHRQERFLREGRAASRIQHPHVVTVFDSGVLDATPYLAMELCEGPTLQQHLAARGPLPIGEAIEVLLPVIAGVAAAHAAGVVHRDLKPGNVILGRDAGGRLHPKVVDFGISKLASEETLTRSQSMMGTPLYVAPEQARSAKAADARSDVYSLGVIAYECLTGRRPFEGEGTVELIHAMLTEPVVAPSVHVAALPEGLDRVVLRALERAPEARFGSVGALGAALAAFGTPEVQARWRAELGEPELGEPEPGEPEPEPVVARGVATPALLVTAQATVDEAVRPRRGVALAWSAVLVVVMAAAAWLALSGGEAAVEARRAELPAASAPARGAPVPSVIVERDELPLAAPAGTRAAQAASGPQATRTATSATPAARARPRPSPDAPLVGDNGAPIIE